MCKDTKSMLIVCLYTSNDAPFVQFVCFNNSIIVQSVKIQASKNKMSPFQMQ